MISRKQLSTEKEGLTGLQNLVEVYEEVAAARMQRIRGAVMQSRTFMEGLVEIFGKVTEAYKKLPERVKIIRRLNNRTVAVLVSANSHLYGDIVEKTFERFSDYVGENKPEVVVLGKVGMQTMADKLPGVLYNYFDFSDETVDMESFSMVMRYLLQFESIVVFHGQFKTILVQEAVGTVVSGEKLTEIEEAKMKEERVKNGMSVKESYLFEPSVEEIARVFEGEILASIFEQSLHESHLAKFASRMLALDRSMENIERRMRSVKADEVKIVHKIRNKKQLQTISGISLWT